MKRMTLLAGTALLVAAGAALAAAGDKPHGPMGGPGMMEQADTNKDGSISKAEAQAARAAHFDKMDANKDGFVEKEEMMAARKAYGGHHGHHGMMLKHADANNDGKVTKAEFTAGAAMHFDKMDSNKDGVLDQADRHDEKDHDGKGHGDKVHDGKHKGGHFAELDANKDGKLSKAEFTANNAMFDQADVNKDGQLSRAEIDAAHAKKDGQAAVN